jgi:hypothetical protein
MTSYVFGDLRERHHPLYRNLAANQDSTDIAGKAIHSLTAVLMSFEESAAANFRCRPRSHSRMIGPTKKRVYGIVVVRGAADNEAINTIATGMM